MNKLALFSILFLALLLPILSPAPVSEQVVFSQKSAYSQYEGFEVTREFSVVDRPILSTTRDVAIHDYSSIVLLTIRNSGTFEKKNIYITQDFSNILTQDGKEGKKTRWDPTPDSLGYGKASHSYKSLLPGEELKISLEVSGRLSKAEFSPLPDPEINSDSATAAITAPKEAEVGQKVSVILKTDAGEPIPNAEISIIGPGGSLQRIKTNRQGAIDYIAKEEGIYIYRAPGLKLVRDAQTKANPIIVSLVTSEFAPKKADEGIFMLFNLGDFAGIIAGLVLVSVALLAVAVFLSLREKGEDEPQAPQPYPQTPRERGIYPGIQTPPDGAGQPYSQTQAGAQAYGQDAGGASQPYQEAGRQEGTPYAQSGEGAGHSYIQGEQGGGGPGQGQDSRPGDDSAGTRSILTQRRRRLQEKSRGEGDAGSEYPEGEAGEQEAAGEPITADEYPHGHLGDFEDEEEEELRRLAEGQEETAEVLEEGKGDFEEGYSPPENGGDAEGEGYVADEKGPSHDSAGYEKEGADSGYGEGKEGEGGQESGYSGDTGTDSDEKGSEFSEDELKKMEEEFRRLQEQEELAREGKIVPVYEEKAGKQAKESREHEEKEELQGPDFEEGPKAQKAKLPKAQPKKPDSKKKRHLAVKKAIEKLERLTRKK